jgi:hypothetical protein
MAENIVINDGRFTRTDGSTGALAMSRSTMSPAEPEAALRRQRRRASPSKLLASTLRRSITWITAAQW